MTHQRLVALFTFGLLCLLACALLSLAVPVKGESSSTQNQGGANSTVKSIDVASTGGDFQTPLDSAIDEGALNIYFTATGPNGSGVFRVPAAGGTATAIYTGHPFVAPNSIAVGSGSQRVFIADPEGWKGGEIFALSLSGGKPEVLRGTEGTAPRGLDVARENGQDVIYFTGRDPNDNQVGVFKINASGASHPTMVAKGAPLMSPDSVTVARSGVVYVTDRGAACAGSVFRIAGSKIEKLLDNVNLGNPAGLALTLDESLLLISALQPDRAHDQVLVLDLKTRQTSSVTKVVENNQDAGGLHRARRSNVFSWADSKGHGTGLVYTVALN